MKKKSKFSFDGACLAIFPLQEGIVLKGHVSFLRLEGRTQPPEKIHPGSTYQLNKNLLYSFVYSKSVHFFFYNLFRIIFTTG
jgi:hypothetical protein